MARMSDQVRAYCTDKGFSGTVKFISTQSGESNVEMQDDGSGIEITKWTVSGVAKPTITTLNTYKTQAEALEKARTDFEDARASHQASAKKKLSDLGLTDDEIKAFFYYEG
tara:strand:- start:450 stop:782 length:333 start_codon:yes stop_codon:yes gene_type:complete